MKSLGWILAGILISLIGLGGYLYIYLGFYKEPQITGEQSVDFWFLYKEHRGAYHLISTLLNEVEKKVISDQLPCEKTFGLFLDNPKMIEEDRLRSEVGCVLAVSPPHVPKGLSLKRWQSPRNLHASFTGSPAVGPFKVYPMIEKWFAQNRLPMSHESLEVYMVGARGSVTTDYYIPINTP